MMHLEDRAMVGYEIAEQPYILPDESQEDHLLTKIATNGVLLQSNCQGQ
jgi:hypothetical protein